MSTDDAEIAKVARDHGAETPFTRPEHLSDDYATTMDVVRHCLDWLEGEARLPDTLCCLYATAPFARAEDIREGQAALSTHQFALPVTSFAFPIQRAVRLKGEGMEMFNPELFATRSQDLDEAYHDAGQFYWGTTQAWRSDQLLFGPNTHPIILPRWRVQDIDTPEDWIRAEAMFEILRTACA